MGKQNNGKHPTDQEQSNMNQVDALMRQAVSEGVFPGAVLLVSKEDAIVCHNAVSYTHLTLPTTRQRCSSRWGPGA